LLKGDPLSRRAEEIELGCRNEGLELVCREVEAWWGGTETIFCMPFEVHKK